MSQLGGTVGCFSSLEACMVPPDTIKASLQEGAFLSVAQGTLGPVSEVHGVFSNRDLLSTFRG